MMPKLPEKLRVVFTCETGNASGIVHGRVLGALSEEERQRLATVVLPLSKVGRVEGADLILSVYPLKRVKEYFTPEQLEKVKCITTRTKSTKPLDVFDAWTRKALAAIRKQLAE